MLPRQPLSVFRFPLSVFRFSFSFWFSYTVFRYLFSSRVVTRWPEGVVRVSR